MTNPTELPDHHEGNRKSPRTMILVAENAFELMTPDPIVLRHDDSISAAIALFTDKGLSSAPVVNRSSTPIGVLSLSDIVKYLSDHSGKDGCVQAFFAKYAGQKGDDFKSGQEDSPFDSHKVFEIMTPNIYSVRIDVPSDVVLAEMLARRVHHLYVVDRTGILVGVISSLDVLRYLN